MLAVSTKLKPEVREKLTSFVLDTLSHLPEEQKNIFIWKHYHGWSNERIARTLRCNISEVEQTLRVIQSRLNRQAGTLLVEEEIDSCGEHLSRSHMPSEKDASYRLM